jgi:hypothetical protein
MEEWLYRSTFFHLGTSCRWMVRFTPRPRYPRGKSPQYLLDSRFSELQNRSGRHEEEKILDPTATRTPTPRSSSLQPVAVPTTLSGLQPGSQANIIWGASREVWTWRLPITSEEHYCLRHLSWLNIFCLNEISWYRRKSLPFLCTTAIPSGTALLYCNLISISFIRGFLFCGNAWGRLNRGKKRWFWSFFFNFCFFVARGIFVIRFLLI